ncbi:MAG TPA: serine/threonine-protein kinase [Pyrinomonadaceae bacterium]|nr:serine/threonine-protein kinase [Pyrinomonadaceae bacterium]
MLECPQCGRRFDAGETVCPGDGALLRAEPTVVSAPSVPAADGDPLIGRTLDEKYRLDERLGEGGMGAVYRATHLLIERPVAVKVLNSRLVTDEAAKERFRREARAAGRIQHSNAVAVTDFGETRDGLVYLVMELLEGRPLRELLVREAPLDPARAVSLMLQAAAAVAAAHEAGVIHRDLKPGNIFVVQRPNAPHLVKVLDFGIAKLAADETGEGQPHDTLTGTGVMIGTPRYMSPEQCDGVPLTPASDVYSLGVILYEMLTGETPFTGATPLALALKHSSEQPRPPRELVGTIPPALEEVVLHALAKSPEERPSDAGEFRRRLYAVAERLGLEHSAGFSAPTIETLREAGTETPSGRLVIDIERLRRQRAAQTAEMPPADTADSGVADTSGRPGRAPQAAPPPSATPAPEAPPTPAPSSSSPAPSASAATSEPAAEEAPRRPVRVRVPTRGGGSWRSALTQPHVFVAVICVALLLLVGAALMLRRPSRPGAAPQGGPRAGQEEAAETVGRTLAPEESPAPRTQPVAQPRSAADFFQSGTYHFSVRDFDSAVRDLRRAVELQPDFPSAHNRLGRALLMKGQARAAAESFRTAVRQRGGNYPVALYNLGFALQMQGDTDEAVASYREAIERRGGNYPDAYFQIGEIFFNSPRRLPESVEAYRKAIEQNGGRDPEANFKLGVALARSDDAAGAEAAFRAAIEQRGGDFAYAHYNLGLLYQQTGRVADAIREFETYLQQAPPRDENRQRAENTLRDLRRRMEQEQRNEGNVNR